MLASLGNFHAYIFGWPVLAKLHIKLLYLCARALGMLNYTSNSISGETKAMRLGVAGKPVPVVFDVGANEGQWIKEMLAICPAAQIHAFEPQKKLAAQIACNFPNVKVNNVALGEISGTLELFDYVNHPGSQHASLLDGVIDGMHSGDSKSQMVSIDTLDNYCKQNQIKCIDFLKIDVEGFELKVLLGAQKLLRNRQVDVIQFEFTHINLVSKTFMRDFFSCLTGSHNLYRLLPHGLLPLRESDHWLNEQFVYQNIIALKRR